MISPYWNKNFLQFFGLLFERLASLVTGSDLTLASDEVQVLVLVLVAISSALVGSFLVLKRMTMLANSLSHTILLGIVCAYLLAGQAISTEGFSMPILLMAALITGLLTTLLTQLLTHLLKVQEDASIGLVFNSLFALGIVLVTLFTRNVHLGVEAIMGNVDALHVHDLKLIFLTCLGTLSVILLFFRQFSLVAFDATYAKGVGCSPLFYTYLLMVLVSATSIGAFRAVGVLLFLAFLVGPTLTARLLTDRLPRMIFLAACIGSLASLIAVALSRHLLSVYGMPVSTAGLVVLVIGLLYFFTLLFAPRRGVLTLRVKKILWKKAEIRDLQREET